MIFQNNSKHSVKSQIAISIRTLKLWTLKLEDNIYDKMHQSEAKQKDKDTFILLVTDSAHKSYFVAPTINHEQNLTR